ncbi:hypothetical protein SV7mr_32150 [Stieleria bergensis]|uniref:Uncharacterized protein n=1 Tax=Stieleria bergensis TaxID=2528025 RepID=A0A517SX19_9BACT|nr:hypothetical protein SV7mr_32150 [Planctomycetes bacterium SV_7m_r]
MFRMIRCRPVSLQSNHSLALLLVAGVSIFVCGLFAGTAQADELPEPALAEKFLHEGTFAEGETACLLALDKDRGNDQVRFGLGVIQFARAIENLGAALHEHGAISEKARQPFLRLPVPKNDQPATISYQEVGRILDVFAHDLSRANQTLGEITDDDVKLPLRLAAIQFDFTGTGKKKTKLIDLLVHFNRGRLGLEKANPEFRVHFDRGDVDWLRAYCHLLSGMVEAYRAVDAGQGFEARIAEIFPKVDGIRAEADEEVLGATIVDPPRLRRMRLHFVAVCDLNQTTWSHIRAETDDDFEWLPKPGQTDQLGLPLSDQQIDAWLEMMREVGLMLKGQRVLSSDLLRFAFRDAEPGLGLNVKKLLDDPPLDFLNSERLNRKGIDAKYLEPEKGKVVNVMALLRVSQFFGGPFGFLSAVRMN